MTAAAVESFGWLVADDWSWLVDCSLVLKRLIDD